MSCIAKITGGRHFDAQDRDELNAAMATAWKLAINQGIGPPGNAGNRDRGTAKPAADLAAATGPGKTDPGFDGSGLLVTAALGQVFFSLGLGGTFLLTYASYLPSTTNLKTSAISVGLGETAASILAGLVIVPAAVVFGLDLESGPPLTFVTVPSIFGQMQAGSFFGALFFGLLFFVAFLSVVAGIEVLVTSAVDAFGWKRRNAAFVFCGTTLILGTVAMVSIDFALTSDLFWGSTMQPVGSALALIALAWVVGLRRALDAVNEGNEGRPVGKLWYYWIKYVIPTGIFIILAVGLKGMFGAFVG